MREERRRESTGVISMKMDNFKERLDRDVLQNIHLNGSDSNMQSLSKFSLVSHLY